MAASRSGETQGAGDYLAGTSVATIFPWWTDCGKPVAGGNPTPWTIPCPWRYGIWVQRAGTR
jgi:hypothetical protein